MSKALNPLVIALLGPTASGKTDLAIELGQLLKIDCLHNIDSRQLYIGMDIGTAKPTKEQQAILNHQLIDLRRPDKPITLWEFQQLARKSIKQTLDKSGKAFLVGGSGLYLKALTNGLEPPKVPPQKIFRNQIKKLGQETAYKLLCSNDPSLSEKISPSDSVRTERALEVLYATGESIQKQQKRNPPDWNLLEIGLCPPDLRERIAKRTTHIYLNGLIEETKNLSDKYGKDLPMLQTIGYREAMCVIGGDLEVNEAILITEKRTNQLAKRQKTWFRKQHNAIWLKGDATMREAMSLIQARLV